MMHAFFESRTSTSSRRTARPIRRPLRGIPPTRRERKIRVFLDPPPTRLRYARGMDNPIDQAQHPSETVVEAARGIVRQGGSQLRLSPRERELAVALRLRIGRSRRARSARCSALTRTATRGANLAKVYVHRLRRRVAPRVRRLLSGRLCAGVRGGRRRRQGAARDRAAGRVARADRGRRPPAPSRFGGVPARRAVPGARGTRVVPVSRAVLAQARTRLGDARGPERARARTRRGCAAHRPRALITRIPATKRRGNS